MAYGDQRCCVCGSGLRQVRCCSLDMATLAPPEASRFLLPLIERAAQARRQGANETAERLCLEVLELSPGQPDMLWMLSRLREAAGHAAAVEALTGRIVALDQGQQSGNPMKRHAQHYHHECGIDRAHKYQCRVAELNSWCLAQW